MKNKIVIKFMALLFGITIFIAGNRYNNTEAKEVDNSNLRRVNLKEKDIFLVNNYLVCFDVKGNLLVDNLKNLDYSRYNSKYNFNYVVKVANEKKQNSVTLQLDNKEKKEEDVSQLNNEEKQDESVLQSDNEEEQDESDEQSNVEEKQDESDEQSSNEENQEYNSSKLDKQGQQENKSSNSEKQGDSTSNKIAENNNSISLQQAIVAEAKSLVGYSYVYGGESREVGFDCSGLTKYVFSKIAGIELSHGSNYQAYNGYKVSLDELQPGDLLFFGTPDDYYHVGIYVGDNKIVNALNSNTGVVEDEFDNWYKDTFMEARRLVN